MGFEFDPDGLSQFKTDGPDMVGLLASAMGLSPQEIAHELIGKMTAAEIEHGLAKCVQELGSGTLISMPLEDLRFAYGYLALLEAGAPIGLDQTKRAIQIALKLTAIPLPRSKPTPRRRKA
jgi:hypothetical protein